MTGGLGESVRKGVGMVHGTGEAIRGKFNAAVDNASGDKASATRNEEIAQKGHGMYILFQYSHPLLEIRSAHHYLQLSDPSLPTASATTFLPPRRLPTTVPTVQTRATSLIPALTLTPIIVAL
jgi:hypothetical protein